MGKTKKFLLNILVFIALIFATFYVLFKNQDMSQILNVIHDVKHSYIFIAILCMFAYLALEAVNLRRTLRNLNESTSFISNYKYAFIGFFFSAITPAASGGQPVQAYYMNKENIKVSNSTLALLINLMCNQTVTISFALISMIFNYKYMTLGLSIFFIVGILLNSIVLAILLLAIFSEKSLDKLLIFIEKFMKLLKLKNIEGKMDKLQKGFDSYKDGAKYIRENRKLLLKNLITAYIQFFIYYSITYWIYKGFGLSGHSILRIVSLQSIVFATVSGIPLPGTVGVNEGAFISILKNVFSHKYISGAMLLSRGISFYLFVGISAIVCIYNSIKNKRKVLEKV